MKTLYLDCGMGAAGDMLMAALLGLHPDPDGFLARLNALDIPGVHVAAGQAVRCGLAATQVRVTVHGAEEDDHAPSGHGHDHGHAHAHEHEHEHSPAHSHADFSGIERLVGYLALPEEVRADILSVYRLIAGAESRAHGVPVEQIHFHEVGTMDAVADITGVCMLMAELGPVRVVASPVHVGSGQVRCAHGVLPVPAPATADLLRGIPIYGGAVRGELCTPTGAALLRYFVKEFGLMPLMRVSKIGYGAGKRDFEWANVLRALLGEAPGDADEVTELRCNLDDMTPEDLGFAQEVLLENGALDVYTTAIGMKKCRPGVMLTCLCRTDDREKMTGLLFRHTSTLGVRESLCRRSVLHRDEIRVETEYGPIRVKSADGWGVSRRKAEYDDLSRIAKEYGLPLEEIRRLIKP